MRQKLKHLRTKRRLEVVVAVSVVLALLLLCWANGRREKDPVRHLRTKTMKGGGGQVMDTPGLKSGVGDIVLAEIGRNLTLSGSLRLIYPLRIQFLHPCKKCGGIIEFFLIISSPSGRFLLFGDLWTTISHCQGGLFSGKCCQAPCEQHLPCCHDLTTCGVERAAERCVQRISKYLLQTCGL